MALPKNPRPQRFRAAAGYLIACACLVWVFHNIRWGELFRNAGSINWWWVAAAVVCDVLSYLCQGVRWRLLLDATGPIPAWRTTQAIYAGLFVNEILPLRTGELVRAYLASRWLGARLSAVVPSILAERFFDAIWLTVAVGSAAFFVPLPKYLLEAEDVLAIGVLAAAGGFVYVAFRGRPSVLEVTSGAAIRGARRGKMSHLLRSVSCGLHQIGRSASFYASFAVSALVLVFQILAFWLVMLAYGLKLPVWVGAVVLLMIHLGTAIPAAPSNVGTYQFFCVVGLTLFGVDKTLATGFSVVVFLVLTFPLWAIGSVAFVQAGLSIRQMSKEFGAISGWVQDGDPG